MMMPSTLKSNPNGISDEERKLSENPSSDRKPRRGRCGKKAVSKRKQRQQAVKRDWLSVPSDVMADIFGRVGVIDVLENVQKVCTTWWRICKDNPSIWRIIDVDGRKIRGNLFFDPEKICMRAVDLSDGELMEVKLKYLGFRDELLPYIADRSSNLKRLQIVSNHDPFSEPITESLKKFPLLEELNLHEVYFSRECIEVLGRCCPMLTSLKVNKRARSDKRTFTKVIDQERCNKDAIAIARNLPQLRHLQLIGNDLTDDGLEAILDGCTNLESLDLRRCQYIRDDEDVMDRCYEQIKFVRSPDDSLKDYEFEAEIYHRKSRYNEWKSRSYISSYEDTTPDFSDDSD